MKINKLLPVILAVILSAGCGKTVRTDAVQKPLSGDELLDIVQKNTFQYFWDGAEPNSGLTRTW
jgi:hypothetical protein